MASITKRGKVWQARITWMDSSGKRHSKSKSGFKTKSQANQWSVQQESVLVSGVQIDKDSTLVDYFDHYIEIYKRPHVTESTYKGYGFIRRQLVNFFQYRKIKDITRTDYQEFINSYGSDHAPKSVQKLHSIMRGCVQSAILDDYIIKDFTQGVQVVANKDKMVKVDYLNLDEIKRLLNYTIDGINPLRRYTSRYIIVTAIYTGMRLAEIQGLVWSDIDYLHETITISKTWDSVNHRFKPTKTESSNRTIKVPDNLIKLLRQLQAVSSSTMVFVDQFGQIPTSNAVNKLLRRLLDELGIKRANFHFHSLRHSHVAILLSQGVDIYAISSRLGHSNISTTTDTYAYLIDEYKDKTDDHIISALDQL
ncbi:tyrosine-type recombinase/integrase [Limosilactobacillus gastricus]|nr:tyrosine-type recombinase/integrase [Limosilactobacillus gastricus]